MVPVELFVRLFWRRFRGLLLVGCGLASWQASSAAPAAWATPPRVQFDVNSTVGCREVTPFLFSLQNPDEKWVEARLPVSAFIQRGSEEDLLQCVYHIVSSRQTMRIVDYAPKTTLASDTAGHIAIEEKAEKDQHMTMGLSTATSAPVKVTTGADLGTKSQQSLRYELLPQMIPVAASGLSDRGYGVSFKLKPSRCASLEGAKEFALTFRVPRTWRADYVQLMCQATGVARGVVPPLTETAVCGTGRFTIALYAEGDAAAKAAADRLVRAESDLLRTVSANRREIAQRLYPSLAQKLGVAEPLLPNDWTERLLYAAPPELAADKLGRRLPDEVRQAVAKYSLAKRELSQLGADDPAHVH